jgi:hypothetical protein
MRLGNLADVTGEAPPQPGQALSLATYSWMNRHVVQTEVRIGIAFEQSAAIFEFGRKQFPEVLDNS